MGVREGERMEQREEPRTPGRKRRVAVGGGVELAVTEYGAVDAPAVVLLHGIGSRGVSWWPVVDALAASFRLIVVDLRGHGASTKPAVGYLLADYAADLEGLLVALAIGRPRLLGHSLGGLVALEWEVRQPGRAAAIVVEDSPLRTEPGVLAAFDGWLELNALTVQEASAHFRTEHPAWNAEECRRRAESITGTARSVFTELRADAAGRLASGRLERFADLATIRSPVLLVHGDIGAGGMVGTEDAARFAATVAESRVVRVAGAGHSIHREWAVEFLAAVAPFLAAGGG